MPMNNNPSLLVFHASAARLRWTPTMDAYDGRLRWTPTMDAYDGRLRWTPTMDAYDGRLRWTPTMDAYDGRLRWTPTMDEDIARLYFVLFPLVTNLPFYGNPGCTEPSENGEEIAFLLQNSSHANFPGSLELTTPRCLHIKSQMQYAGVASNNEGHVNAVLLHFGNVIVS